MPDVCLASLSQMPSDERGAASSQASHDSSVSKAMTGSLLSAFGMQISLARDGVKRLHQGNLCSFPARKSMPAAILRIHHLTEYEARRICGMSSVVGARGPAPKHRALLRAQPDCHRIRYH